MKSTGSRMKLETKFLALFWTLSAYRAFLLGVRGCATFDLSTLHHLLMVEFRDSSRTHQITPNSSLWKPGADIPTHCGTTKDIPAAFLRSSE